VAAAVFRRRAAGDAVFLDTPGALGARFADHFPSVAEQARAHGLDPASRAIPVRPAAHYTMGGVRADASGRTTLPGLWACGEVAATGLHGANRLASNSMLEGVVMARWLAEDIAGISAPARPDRAAPAADAETGMAVRAAPGEVRRIMDGGVGVLRDRAGLIHAIRRLSNLCHSAGAPAEVALMVAVAALQRAESRGAHQRSEAPRPASVHAQAHCLTRTDVLNAAAALAGSGTREAA
jgi:L-aspartate oxidase